MLLQMWDCSNAESQTFVYDEQTQELKIGSLCVTAWGAARPGDPIALDSCKGGANQHWKAVAVGDYYQFVIARDLCLDLHYGRKDRGATLQTWACKQGETAQLWAFIEVK